MMIMILTFELLTVKYYLNFHKLSLSFLKYNLHWYPDRQQ